MIFRLFILAHFTSLLSSILSTCLFQHFLLCRTHFVMSCILLCSRRYLLLILSNSVFSCMVLSVSHFNSFHNLHGLGCICSCFRCVCHYWPYSCFIDSLCFPSLSLFWLHLRGELCRRLMSYTILLERCGEISHLQ